MFKYRSHLHPPTNLLLKERTSNMNERFGSTFITTLVDASFPFFSSHYAIALLRKKRLTNDNDPSLNLGRNQ
jgi:hypothetical protein